MTDETERHPERVPAGANPGEEVRAQWAWTEPSVWTERMLTALDGGERRTLGGPSTVAQRLLCQAWAVLAQSRPRTGLSVLGEVNHQPESRMRETRTSGSEGGGAG